jgi:hypothetical protein
MPETNPNGAAQLALEKYDTNKDGQIKGEELVGAPSLASALGVFDANNDRGIDPDEIAARISAWHDSQIPLAPLRITVNRGQNPIVGATVKLIPEDFLGDDFRAADGITDEFGIAIISIPEDNRPTPDSPTGVQFGLYRIEITQQENGKEAIPSKYNSESTLGIEVSYENPQIVNPPLIIELK